MNEFENNNQDFENDPVKEEVQEGTLYEEVKDPERNTDAPSGWTYSANTNQYVSWGGNGDANQNRYQEQQRQQPRRQEYGTCYGYYGTQNQNQYTNESYKWDFNRYESPESSPAPGKKKSNGGLKVLACILVALVCIGFVSAVSIGLYKVADNYFDIRNRIKSGENENLPEKSNNGIHLPELNLENIPDDNKTVSTNGSLSGTEIYKMVSPSVVGIVKYEYQYSFEATGFGSGIILSEDGYIVTNAHVVDGAEVIKVVLYNEEEYEATIVGSDKQTDIAVLKIDENNLVKAELGDSTQVEIGEDCYVLGNPGGLSLQSSFSDGIISGLDRIITTEDSIYSMTVIQTTAAVNPGNSGGALINEYGQIIGITSSKVVSTDFEGIGFAIPTAIAKPIIEEIIANGYVSGRAMLGITGTTVDSVTAKYYNVPEGVQIVSIEATGCLYGTEVQVGDIITGFNNTTITQMDDLQSCLAESTPGDEVTLTIFRHSATGRNNKTFTVDVKLIENKG